MVIATTFLTRFIYASVNYIFAVVLFSQLSTYKKDKKIAVTVLILTAIASGAIFAGMCEIGGLTVFFEVLIWFFASIPIFVVQMLFSADKLLRDSILLLTQTNVVMFNVTMMYYFSVQVFQHDFRSSLLYGAGIYIVLAVAYHFIFGAMYKRIVRTTNPQRRIWNLFFIIPCAFIVLQTTFVSIVDIRDSVYYCIVVIFLAATMMLVYGVMFYSFRLFEEKQRIAEQNGHLATQNAMWLKQLEQNEMATENTRRARHDMRHHDALLATLLDGQKYDEARAYLSEHMRAVENLQPVVYCKHKGINGILQSIVESAKANGINPSVSAVVPESFNADLVDMCGLFFNLAENAVKECKKLPELKRALTIEASCENDRLALSVINPCADDVEMYNGHPVRKGDRDGGVGTRSVMGIVEKYHGVINYDYSDGTFTAKAVIFSKKDD